MMRAGVRWKARYSVLIVLAILWIATNIERTVLSVVMPYIAADFHLTPLNTGIVLSIFYAGYAITQVPGGLLADLFGVRIVATVSILWRAAFVALTGAVSSLGQLLAVRVLFGLGDGVFPASAFKTIAIWFPKGERTRANALMFAVMPLGTALAPLLMIPIVSIWGWRAAFYALLPLGIATAVLFWVVVKNSPPDSARETSIEHGTEDKAEPASKPAALSKSELFDILRRPEVVKYFLIVLTYDIGYWGYLLWLPTYLVSARGFSLAQMGMAASLPSFAGVAGCLFGGWISDKYFSSNRRVPIIVGQLIAAALLYLTFTADTVTKLIVYQALSGFFLESFFSTFWALPMTTVSERLMGVTSGFINMAGQIATFVSPIVIGVLVSASGGGYALTFGFLIVAILMSSIIVLTVSEQPTPATGDP